MNPFFNQPTDGTNANTADAISPASSDEQPGGTCAVSSAQDAWNERFSQGCAELEQTLLAAGVSPQRLMDEWGVVLWSIRAKEHKIKLKMEAFRPVDEAALRQWFMGIFGAERELSLKFSPASKCCFSPCDGCLMGNAAKRALWFEPGRSDPA